MKGDHADRDLIRERAQADFGRLVSEYGAKWRGKMFPCLFHEDKTPSAHIHKGYYVCFSCGLRLDPISFMMRIEGRDFKTALASLGDRYGVSTTSKQSPQDRARRQLDRAQIREAIRWRNFAMKVLRARRDTHVAAARRATQHIIANGMEGEIADYAADVADTCEAEAQRGDVRLDYLKGLRWAELVALYQGASELVPTHQIDAAAKMKV